MKKQSLVILPLVFASLISLAQPVLTERSPDAPKERFIDRIYTGGGFGLQFGSSQTYVEFSPMIGYKINERFSAGISLKYIYFKFHDDYLNYSTNIYGGGPFARFLVFENLFLHAEYEMLNLDVPDVYNSSYSRQNISSVFIGGGYRQMMGDNSALDLLILYNINENRNSPYTNPIIRFGFALGI